VNKIRIFCLAFWLFSIMSMAVFPASAQAAPISQVISLEGDYVILPDSDVELVALGGGRIYAVVLDDDDNYCFLFSDSGGATWTKAGQGLPKENEFICLEVENSVVALATEEKVYRSQDGGQTFGSLGGPTGLRHRGEEISCIAVNLSQVAVGIRNPSDGEFPLDGIYIYGRCGSEWEAQGMRQSPLGGFDADVTSITFAPSGESVIAVATGEDGTYMVAGCTQQTGNFWAGAKWSDAIEVAQSSGQSPKEGEMISSMISWMKDGSWSDVGPKAQFNSYKLLIAYNSSQEAQSDVYQVGLSFDLTPSKVSRLSLPKSLTITGLASNENTIVVAGIDEADRILVYCRNSVTVVWKQMFPDNDRAQSPRVVIAPDDTIFVGTSGEGSYFSRSEKGNLLVPISLIDSGGDYIEGIYLSQKFSESRTLYVTFAGRSLFRLVLDKDYQLVRIERLFYTPEYLNEMGVKGYSLANGEEDLLVYQADANSDKVWWGQYGLHWTEKTMEVRIQDVETIGDKAWIAGEDGMIYVGRSGVASKTISSGMSWVGKLEPGLPGTVLAAGGSDEYCWEVISVINGNSCENSCELLPFLPEEAVMEDDSDGFMVCHSPTDNAVYCVAEGNDLYKFVIGGSKWEKIGHLSRSEGIFPSARGLYNFSGSEVLFAPFPITEESVWLKIPELKGHWQGCQVVGLKTGEDLLIVWDGPEIHILRYYAQAESQVKPTVTSDTAVETQTGKDVTKKNSKVAPSPEKNTAPTNVEVATTFGAGALALIIIIVTAQARKK